MTVGMTRERIDQICVCQNSCPSQRRARGAEGLGTPARQWEGVHSHQTGGEFGRKKLRVGRTAELSYLVLSEAHMTASGVSLPWGTWHLQSQYRFSPT